MRTFITLLTIILLPFFSNQAHSAARDEQLTEMQIREAAKTLERSLSKTLPSLPNFGSVAEFNRFAENQRLSQAELKRDIQLLARLKMELYNKDKDRYIIAKRLIEQLELISNSAFDKSYVLMLKGRHAGRSQQDYTSAISLYQQAVTLMEMSTDETSLILRYTLQEHLGMMHMILREETTALLHLKELSRLSKQLQNDYLIAHAESVLGKYFYKQNQLGKSLSHYTEATKYSQGDKSSSQSAHIELQLARIYRDLESWEEALSAANNAAETFSQLGNENYVSSSMTVIAMIYANQGQWYKAIDYHLNAQHIESKLGNYIGLGLNLHNLGEAYYKIGDTHSALENLKRANEIFTSRKSNHYLVYNDLLISEVAANDANWEMSLDYASKAADIAESKQLNAELKEAISRQTDAFEALGLYEEAFNSAKKLNSLNKLIQPQSTGFDEQKSIIAEQKLELSLSQAQNELQTKIEQFNNARLVTIFCVFALCLTLLILLKLWRHKNKLSIETKMLQQTQLLEPFTRLHGYLAFKQDYANSSNNPMKTMALISLSDQLNADISQGYECNSEMNKQQILAIKNSLNCHTYVIRPGLFLLGFNESIEPNHLLTLLRNIISNHHGKTSLHMGILHLPLLADPAIKLTAAQHYGSLQMMLHAARTLGNDKDYFVTMKMLNFASAGIFNNPLYLNIEKSIVRGIIKVDTNGNKEKIIWPRWKSHQDIDINEDKLAI
ncbi:tetratricopeptide repeat protein [Shewanella schlegeliana]|uniref:Tetratricopeptide repeat protein n=1 Tax=Shewanella schlegeliana TaxID=190308 RepID=A0ABS1SY87_9GAMM|nr:tetratricopeptide repeat protein [Shewanella schlegeliana]